MRWRQRLRRQIEESVCKGTAGLFPHGHDDDRVGDLAGDWVGDWVESISGFLVRSA